MLQNEQPKNKKPSTSLVERSRNLNSLSTLGSSRSDTYQKRSNGHLNFITKKSEILHLLFIKVD